MIASRHVCVFDPFRCDGVGPIGGVPWPDDVGLQRAGRDEPVVARRIRAGLEPHFDAVLECEEALVVGGDGDGFLARVVPASHLGAGAEVGDVDGRGDLEHFALGQHDFDQVAGFASEFAAVIGDLGELTGCEREHCVAPGALHTKAGRRVLSDEARDDGPVVPRPLEGRCAERTGAVDLDSVELVLQPSVPGAGRQLTDVGGTGLRYRPSPHPPGARRNQLLQLRPGRVASVGADRGRDSDELHLAGGPDAGGGVGPAERALEQVGVLERGHVPPPDVEMGEVGPLGEIERDAGCVEVVGSRRVELGRVAGHAAGTRAGRAERRHLRRRQRRSEVDESIRHVDSGDADDDVGPAGCGQP